MKIISFIGVLITSLFLGTTYAQTNVAWGDLKYGVQMSIALESNIMVIGTSSVLQCQIKNESVTNDANFVSDPAQDVQVILIGDSGEKYEVTPSPLDTPGGGVPHELISGKAVQWIIPIKLNKDVKSGNYSLIGVAYMAGSSQHDGYKLVSNSLKVQVK